MQYDHISVPADDEAITINRDHSINVPDQPIIPFIEGDGIGIGIAPGGNIGEGVAVFEATHGTAPGFAGKDRVNPGSLILSAEMMLRYIGWHEAADNIMNGVARTIANKELTFDLARLREAMHQPIRKERPRDKDEVVSELEQLIPGATLVGTKGFGEAVIRHMDD